MTMNYHNPVMLVECLEGLNIQPDGVYVDVTFGGGGHSEAILQALGPQGKLLAFDQDPDSRANRITDDRFILIHANFRYLQKHLRLQGHRHIDGLLADLGISSHQIDTPERGFSTRFEARLDMRMNPAKDFDAATLLQSYAIDHLARVLHDYGEFKQAYAMARALETFREEHALETTMQLQEALKRFAPRQQPARFWARLFQALRIEVNDELGALKQLLPEGSAALKPGGRMVVMSYHSLEDRLVKNFFRYGNLTGEPVKDFYGHLLRPLEPINRRPIEAGEEELALNPRARSAKLRIAQKNGA